MRFSLLTAVFAFTLLASFTLAGQNYTIVTSCPSYAANDTATVAYKVVLDDVAQCDELNALLAVTSPSGVNATYFPATSCDVATGIHSFLISTGESGVYTVQPFDDNSVYNPVNSSACSITSYKRAQTRVPDANPLLALLIGVLAAGFVAANKRKHM